MTDLFSVEDESGVTLAYAEGAPYAKCLQAAEHYARRLDDTVFIVRYEGTEQVECYAVTAESEDGV
jgi:hypothetical protein